MKKSIKFGIGALLVAALLIGVVMVPTASAKKNDTQGNVSIQSISTTATLGVSPTTGSLSTTFSFNAQATYELDVYGIPVPGNVDFEHDISYTAFHQPVITGSSFTNPSFVYKASSPIGPSWNFYRWWTTLGGPTTEYLNSHTWPKTTGNYNNRLASHIGLVSSSQDTKTVLIS